LNMLNMMVLNDGTMCLTVVGGVFPFFPFLIAVICAKFLFSSCPRSACLKEVAMRSDKNMPNIQALAGATVISLSAFTLPKATADSVPISIQDSHLLESDPYINSPALTFSQSASGEHINRQMAIMSERLEKISARTESVAAAIERNEERLDDLENSYANHLLDLKSEVERLALKSAQELVNSFYSSMIYRQRELVEHIEQRIQNGERLLIHKDALEFSLIVISVLDSLENQPELQQSFVASLADVFELEKQDREVLVNIVTKGQQEPAAENSMAAKVASRAPPAVLPNPLNTFPTIVNTTPDSSSKDSDGDTAIRSSGSPNAWKGELADKAYSIIQKARSGKKPGRIAGELMVEGTRDLVLESISNTVAEHFCLKVSVLTFGVEVTWSTIMKGGIGALYMGDYEDSYETLRQAVMEDCMMNGGFNLFSDFIEDLLNRVNNSRSSGGVRLVDHGNGRGLDYNVNDSKSPTAPERQEDSPQKEPSPRDDGPQIEPSRPNDGPQPGVG